MNYDVLIAMEQGSGELAPEVGILMHLTLI